MKTTLLLVLLTLIPLLGFGQCVTTGDENVWQESWLSCEISPHAANPSISTHWIQYDLGQVYNIDSLHIWNYNIDSSQVSNGINQFILYTSLDSFNWTNHGSQFISQATGSSSYLGQGFGLDNPEAAQYVLLEAENNHGGPCSGLSEVAIGVVRDTCFNFQPEVIAEYNVCDDIFNLEIDMEKDDGALSILWSNGSATSRISGLAEGAYHVAVETNACTQVVEIELKRPVFSITGWESGDNIPTGTYSISQILETSGSIQGEVDF